MDAFVLTRYPFLNAAKGILGRGGFESLSQGDLDSGRRRALSSVERGLTKGVFVLSLPQDAPSAVRSYAVARMLLAAVDMDYYWYAFAVGEARQAALLMEKNAGDAVEVCRDFFPSVEFGEAGDYGCRIPVIEYLSQNAEKLSHRQVESGAVRLDKVGLFEVLKQTIYRRCRQSPPRQALPKQISEMATAFREELREKFPPVAKSAYSGKYLSLPCVKAILAGVPEGRRYYASMSLAVACRRDELPQAEAELVMQQFVSANQPGSRPFTFREAKSSLEWVYKRNINFSCKYQREHGLADVPECRGSCPISKSRRQSAPVKTGGSVGRG